MLPTPILQTAQGRLFQGDCLSVLRSISDAAVDLIFADPPFNELHGLFAGKPLVSEATSPFSALAILHRIVKVTLRSPRSTPPM
jgi:DNA modification methylase